MEEKNKPSPREEGEEESEKKGYETIGGDGEKMVLST